MIRIGIVGVGFMGMNPTPTMPILIIDVIPVFISLCGFP